MVPYVVLILASGFTEDVRALEEVAAVHGAGPRRRLAALTLPAVAPALAAAAVPGFLVSWSRYGLSLAVDGGIPMLPVLLVPFVGTDPQVAAVLGVVFLAPALAAVALAVRLAGRSDAGAARSAPRAGTRRGESLRDPRT